MRMQRHHSKNRFNRYRVHMFHNKEKIPNVIGILFPFDASSFMMLWFYRLLIFLLGPHIPHPDREDVAEWRAFLLLLLFKPWRCVSDLKSESRVSWSQALTEFIESNGTKQCELLH